MRTRTTFTAAALLLAALTACGSDNAKADPQACKTAMAKQLEQGVAAADSTSPQPTSSRPAACAGVDDATLKRLVGEVTTEWLDSDQADKAAEDALKSVTPVPVPTDAEISPECRTWIENELQDSSEDIDSTAGSDACGDLSEEELDQAIQDVTQDLIDATP
ncbi:hypothetical protein [Streptomyces sp. NPDC005486]|uniref:hypothetical protein n=1 Tax=Streptomyces sp. NPDC005486 TaxID=3155345 RepID=UPI0033ABEE35